MRKILLLGALSLVMPSLARSQTAVQAFGNFSVATGTTLVATGTTSAGSLLTVCMRGNGVLNTTPTDTATNTYNLIGTTNNSSATMISCYETHSGGAVTTVTCNWSSTTTNRACLVYEISGANMTTPVDASVTLVQAGATSCTSAALTTTNANDILILACSTNTNLTFVAGTDYTLPTNGTQTRLGKQYKNVSATQSAVTANMTWGGGTVNDLSVFFAIKAAAGAAAPPATQMLTGVGD